MSTLFFEKTNPKSVSIRHPFLKRSSAIIECLLFIYVKYAPQRLKFLRT